MKTKVEEEEGEEEEEEGGFLTSGSQPRNSKAELKNWAGTGGFTTFFL